MPISHSAVQYIRMATSSITPTPFPDGYYLLNRCIQIATICPLMVVVYHLLYPDDYYLIIVESRWGYLPISCPRMANICPFVVSVWLLASCSLIVSGWPLSPY
jgi:hypothetical protein